MSSVNFTDKRPLKLMLLFYWECHNAFNITLTDHYQYKRQFVDTDYIKGKMSKIQVLLVMKYNAELTTHSKNRAM